MMTSTDIPLYRHGSCPLCAAEYDGFVEGYAEGKGWESPRTWDIYDDRLNEIRNAFDDYQALQTAALYDSSSAAG